jgi:hypothetical protein
MLAILGYRGKRAIVGGMDLPEFLDVWKAELAAALDRVLPLLEQRFSYPPDQNTIGPAAVAVPLDLPADLATLYRRVGPVTLPDIGEGLFIEPPQRLVRSGEAVFFARAGATRFAYVPVAFDLRAFLDRFRDAVVAFADTGQILPL